MVENEYFDQLKDLCVGKPLESPSKGNPCKELNERGVNKARASYHFLQTSPIRSLPSILIWRFYI